MPGTSSRNANQMLREKPNMQHWPLSVRRNEDE